MGDEENSFEALRRELIALLFEAYKRHHDLSYGLEKVLVSLSAGSLLFSMTFISALAPGRHWLGILFGAWIFFAASIVCVIFGMKRSAAAEASLLREWSDTLGELEKSRGAVRVAFTGRVEAKRSHAGVWLTNCALGAFLESTHVSKHAFFAKDDAHA
jgi:hypothetical protein